MWVHIHEVEAKAFLGRDLTKTEEVRFKDKNASNLKLENLEVFDTTSKTVVPFSTTAELEVTK